MSFLDRAKQAASQAADQAKQAAEQAKHAAEDVAHRTSATLSDPATERKAREALGRAKRGVATAIDRIDPGVLADIIIKATSLQERANQALRAKGSLYRISEISIGAAVPPSVTFAIARMDDPDLDPSSLPGDSTKLLAQLAADGDEPVLALDGRIVEPVAAGDEG